jgi:hypothetical protein
LAVRLGYISENKTDNLESKLTETEKVLGSLVRSLRKPQKPIL